MVHLDTPKTGKGVHQLPPVAALALQQPNQFTPEPVWTLAVAHEGPAGLVRTFDLTPLLAKFVELVQKAGPVADGCLKAADVAALHTLVRLPLLRLLSKHAANARQLGPVLYGMCRIIHCPRSHPCHAASVPAQLRLLVHALSGTQKEVWSVAN